MPLEKKTMKCISFCFFLTGILLYHCLFGNVISFATAVNNKQTFVEADFVKTSQNSFYASGNVIMRRLTMLVNADEIEAIKELKVTQKETENIVNNSNLNTDKNNNNSNKEKYRFFIRNWAKIRTDDDNLIFSKKMFYDEASGTGWLQDAQIFPGQKKDHTEIFANKIEKQGCNYTLTNTSICPCNLFTDSNVDADRKTKFSQITDNDEILEKPIGKNAIDNTSNEMHKKLRTSIISMQTEKMNYNADEKTITINKMKIRLLGLTIGYIPRYTLHTDDSGDTGFLMPQLVFMGTRQLGIEIPFYWKIRSNMDFFASRTQYFDLRKPLYADSTDKRLLLRDRSRFRNHTTQARFRHLISTANAYESFYTLSGTLVDKSQLVDNDSGLGKLDGNGNIVYGYRWMADIKARLKFTKTTFLSIDWNEASDRNIAYYYKLDYRQLQSNHLHFYDINYNRYFSAEIYNYQSRLLKLDKLTTPKIYPILRGNYDFKKDKLGGHFYVNSKAHYLNRKEGYDVASIGIKVGYTLPYYTKYGTKLTFDTMLSGKYNYVDYSNVNSRWYNAGEYLRDNTTFYFGNYGGFIRNGYYATLKEQVFSKFSFMNTNKIQAEHPVLIRSNLGKTTITPKIAIKYTPKIAIKYTPKSRRNIYLPLEDALGVQLNYYNAFDLLQSEGINYFDTGANSIYGISVKHKFNNNISVYGGLRQNIRMTHPLDEEILAEYTGFRQTMSDILMNFGFKAYGLQGHGYFNYDTNNGELRTFGGSLGFYHKYFSINADYNLFAKSATIFNYDFDLLTLTATISPTDKLRFVASIKYNFNGTNTQVGYKKADITYYMFGVYYIISCMELGLYISENKFTLYNLPTTQVIRFKFTFTGIG